MLYEAKKMDEQEEKNQFIDWLKNVATDLDGREENPEIKEIFPGSEVGDVATIKDIVGNFLVLLTGADVEIK